MWQKNRFPWRSLPQIKLVDVFLLDVASQICHIAAMNYRTTDEVLDAFSSGKINKEQMASLLKEQEFAKNNPVAAASQPVKQVSSTNAANATKARDPFDPNVSWKTEFAPAMPNPDRTAADIVSGGLVSLVTLALNPAMLEKKVAAEIGKANTNTNTIKTAFDVIMKRIEAISPKVARMVFLLRQDISEIGGGL